jgi:hypothetical protein
MERTFLGGPEFKRLLFQLFQARLLVFSKPAPQGRLFPQGPLAEGCPRIDTNPLQRIQAELTLCDPRDNKLAA